jgi:hypothetical protein
MTFSSYFRHPDQHCAAKNNVFKAYRLIFLFKSKIHIFFMELTLYVLIHFMLTLNAVSYQTIIIKRINLEFTMRFLASQPLADSLMIKDICVSGKRVYQKSEYLSPI